MSILWNIYQVWIVHNYSPKWKWIVPAIHLEASQSECTECIMHLCGICYYYTSDSHQIEKSDWSRAFNQFTIACELDMRNAISAADIAFIMSSSKSAWLLSPLECSPQEKKKGWTLRFCFCFSCLCYLPRPSASADNTNLGFDNSWYHAQPHPIIVYCTLHMNYNIIQPRLQGASLCESEKVGKSPWITLFKKPETNW